MKRWLRRGAVALLAGTLTGCANVKVEKVDLQKRIDGQDQCVKGFRYYLTRPYLVVGSRVTVSTTYIPASIAVFPAGAKAGLGQPLAPGTELVLVAQVPDDQGKYRVYDRAGKLRPDLRPGQVRILQAGTQQMQVANSGVAVDFQAIADQVVPKTVGLINDLKIDPAVMAMNPQAWKDLIMQGTPIKTALNNHMNEIKTLLAPGGADAVSNAVSKALQVAIDAVNTSDVMKKAGKQIALDPMQLKTLTDQISKALSPQTKPMPMPMPPPAADSEKIDAAATLASNGAKAAPAPAAAGDGGNGGAAGAPPEAFQVIFLPDFEEQYAINNVNVLAKTKYKYTFRNGTDLETMAGAYDGTDVPIEILNTVGSLVKAFGAVAQTRLNPSGAAGAAALTLQANQQAADYYVRIEQAIEPGVYRVQKSWERAAAAPLDGVTPEQACGLFADVGLPILETTSVITADQYNTFNPPPAKPANVTSK